MRKNAPKTPPEKNYMRTGALEKKPKRKRYKCPVRKQVLQASSIFDWLISEKLFYFLEVGIVFSLVFCRARIPKLHVCIVFAGFCRTTYSHSGDPYRLASTKPANTI
jgi:hypothetical protein